MVGKKTTPKSTDTKAPTDPTPQAPKPRLRKLRIRNFRCIGTVPVEIELDDIVVLVGKNNAGKSSILRACEVAMQTGQAAHLTIDDFPNREIIKGQLPEIELETTIYDRKGLGEQWINVAKDGEEYIWERFTWSDVGEPTRQGYNVNLGRFDSDKAGPWGAANVVKGKRPKPYRVEAFASPEKQAEKIVALLAADLTRQLSQVQSESDGEVSERPHRTLLDDINAIQQTLIRQVAAQAGRIESSINEIIGRIFPDHTVTFKPYQEDDKVAGLLFKSGVQLRMGPTNGHMSDLERQGSGARRTLLWAALRYLAEVDSKNESGIAKPFILLMDEPELCLHPNAIRDARNVLYQLAEGDNWQVIITTHSPIFLDLARSNTTIIRVEHNGDRVSGTTLFRTKRAHLSLDDCARLKMLNQCDPYFAEFFFGGRTIIVEGDTEHTAFQHILEHDEYRQKYDNLHIVRARGKDRIVTLCKILNRFGSPYAVLHDSDLPTSPAWDANGRIIAEVNCAIPGIQVQVVALLSNFERFCWNDSHSKLGEGDEKPYAALARLRHDPQSFARVAQLLAYLAGKSDQLPSRAVEWRTDAQLRDALNSVGINAPPPIQTSLLPT